MPTSGVCRDLGEAAWSWVLGQLQEDDGPWLPELVPGDATPEGPGEDRDLLYAGIAGLRAPAVGLPDQWWAVRTGEPCRTFPARATPG